MDWRVKSFESEARSAFAHLVQRGFTVGSEQAADLRRRPAKVTVRFQGAEVTVETSLVFGFAGEDGVHTTLLTTTGSSDLGPTVAHSRHESARRARPGGSGGARKPVTIDRSSARPLSGMGGCGSDALSAGDNHPSWNGVPC